MARYKRYDVDQDKFIPVSFRAQILPGTFEHALSEIVDQHIDLSVFAARSANDATGWLAYDRCDAGTVPGGRSLQEYLRATKLTADAG